MTRIGMIAVGYDGSPESELAVDWAIQRAQTFGANLTILRATRSEDAAASLVRSAEISEESQRKLPGLKRAVDALGTERVQLASQAGSASAVLVEVSHKVDLIVIGTRGRGTLVAGVMGSTAYAVAGHAACPVVIVRAPKDAEFAVVPDAKHPVVVGVEDLKASKNVVERAARMAIGYGSPLRLVRASQPVPYATAASDAFLIDPALDESLTANDEAILREVRDHVREKFPDLDIEAVFEEGEPAHVLVENAQDAGLIVVGSRGLGGFSGLLLGSVSHAIIHLAHVPVAVIR